MNTNILKIYVYSEIIESDITSSWEKIKQQMSILRSEIIRFSNSQKRRDGS